MTEGTHIAYADEDLMRDATLSATNEDSDYPVERLQVDDQDSPVFPFKSTTTGTVITIALPTGSGTPDGIAIIHHNLAGAPVTLANGVGFSEVIAIPPRTRSGLQPNVWFDMREMPNRNADEWTLTITGNSVNVAIGRIVLVGQDALAHAPFLVKTPTVRPERLTTRLRTTFGHELVYDKGVRQRAMSGRTITDDHRVILENAWEAAAGTVTPFLLVPQHDENDAWWVRFKAFEYSQDVYQDVSPAHATLEEVALGPHLYL
jgi:hypothetical protein